MELEGSIGNIIYQNELNSYLIATFETEEEMLTIVGYIPFVKEGDSIKVFGKFVEHRDYGRQFKVDTFEKIMPQTLEALEKYLSNGNVKGVGEVTAKKIIKKFGENTINIFKNDADRLAEIKGITLTKARKISESFLENWEVWQIVGFLEKFGIGAEHAKKVCDLYGTRAIEEIEVNPYILIDIARGVNFKQIDKMALDLGIEYNNEKRVKSGIKYALITSSYNGHSCILLENLREYVISMLDVLSDDFEDALVALKVKNEIIIEEQLNEKWVYLYAFYNAESQIANRLQNLQLAKSLKKVEKIEKKLNQIELNSKIELSEKQREAIKAINENNVLIITGGPGTGKTTIIKTIIDLYEEKGYKVVLTAPTGRAAKKMTETTKREASTLHRLLEIGKIDEDSLYKDMSNYQGAPIDADLIIVDEVSMVDMFLMNYLLQCIYQGTKLILVGDSDQLASVGPGSVLSDLIKSETIETIHLDKIFRQAAKSKIILNAHRVNDGKRFLKKEDKEIENTEQDFFYINKYNADDIIKEVVSLCTGRLQNYGDYDFMQNIQVLTPTKRGQLGTKELNKILQEYVNPLAINKKEKISGSIIYRVGDRVMQIKNNYDIYWEKQTYKGKELGAGIFNGEIGTIVDIIEREKQIEVQFDDEKIARYDFSNLDQIEHSYAITIHKAQRKRI